MLFLSKDESNNPEKFITDSGIVLPEYLSESSSQPIPGDYPYTRGVHKSMYRSKLWTMRQYAGFGTAEESNERYKFLIANGTMGLSVAFDLPTQIGYDSDDPMAEGEVGKVGVAIDSLKDMETLFDGIKLSDITTSMTINSTASLLLLMYVAIAKKQNSDLKKLSGTIQNDILKEYIARGTYIYPPKQSLRLITDTFKWCNENLPSWNTISISGYHIREAGSSAAQEVAFTLSNGIEYVKAAINSGLDVDSFAKRLSFFFNAHNNFIEEIAKFRAARRMWAKIMKEKFNAKDPNSMKLRFHAQTGGSTLTDTQIDNNIVRVTVQALSAVLGGCQSLHTNGKDEALSLPTEDAVQTALRTQQILAYESGVADSVDPMGGSYLIEYMTDEIEKKANEYINRIEEMGGALKAIEVKFQKSEIENNAYDFQMDVEHKKKIIVGVNEFTSNNKEEYNIFRVNESVRKIQIEKLKSLKEKRDNLKVNLLLDEIKNAAQTEKNLLPYFLEAIENYATIGEISNTLRTVWGEYK
ncbi:MAG TPA: methylmalonyl-CoA mutase [Bacteroidetes bacterium]|nr:methylmalonyl-CoA mutase [Bacteroidota bacterium]